MKSDTGASEALMASEEDCDRRKDTELSKRSYGNDNCTKEEKGSAEDCPQTRADEDEPQEKRLKYTGDCQDNVNLEDYSEIRSDGFGSVVSETAPNLEENLFQSGKNGQERTKICPVLDIDDSTGENGSEKCQDVEEKVNDCQMDEIENNVVVDRSENLDRLEASQNSSELVENSNENAEQKESKSFDNCHDGTSSGGQEEQSREGLLCADSVANASGQEAPSEKANIVETNTDLDASVLVSSDLAENPQKSVAPERNDPNSESVVGFEKAESNPELLGVVRRHPMASKWESTSHEPHALLTVCPGTSEYETVEKVFQLTARGHTINKLERVENPYLLGHYLLKKEKMEKEHGTVEERSLFHGTQENYVDDICRFNFDWRRKGSSRGHKFGQGVSFTPEVSYARHYTPDRVMLLVKVLVAKLHIGQSDTVVPMESYDTTRNSPGTVIVKYEDDDFYPQYVIHYK